MKNTIDEPANAIPIVRADTIAPPHNRDQLRKRLLQMIVRSETERRSLQTTAGGAPKPTRRTLRESNAKLNVFDPDDLIGREASDANFPQRRA
jgi:hypothetical protein